MAAVVALAIIAFFLLIFVASAVKIIRPFQRGVKERLGSYRATLDPGLRVIVPFVDKLRIVDMREQVLDVPPQEVITSDNVVVSVDAVVYYEPTDPQRLIYNVANFVMAVTKLAQTNLRNVVGDMQLDQALTSRDTINHGLRDSLDDATDKWGVRVARVEIQRIDPPPDVIASMHEQMKAERTRRAVVLEADGQREAAIAQAEGVKQSEILRAEAQRQRQILEAQGDAEATMAIADAERYRQITVAEGEARAITTVFDAIHAGDPSPDLLAVKYLESLGTIADGQATKIFLPADFASGLGGLAAVAELFRNDDGGASAREHRASSAGERLAAEYARTDAEREANAKRDKSAPKMSAPVVPIPEAPAPPPPPGNMPPAGI
ncbi:MAG: SPFH/Band 7/PHB domain protein [Actinobacteria bacterium]|nr:SPFH/Band 7/PHB domain protein [Actinomycetota bacterium]